MSLTPIGMPCSGPAILAFRQLVGEPFRFRQSVFAINEHPGVNVLFPAVDRIKTLLDEIDRRDAPALDRLGRFVDGLDHRFPKPRRRA